MLSEEDAVRLHHMLEAAREAVGYAKDRTRADLDADRQLTHSLVRCIEITGEAANRVSKKFRDANQQVPWAPRAGIVREALRHPTEHGGRAIPKPMSRACTNGRTLNRPE